MITHEFMMRHVDEGISIRALAKELNMHPNKLRRAMIKAGVPILSAQEALQKGYEQGRLKARSGHNITEEHKLIIAKSQKNKKRTVQTKNNYILQKNNIARAKGALGNRESAKKGSKFERMVFDKLTAQGYTVLQQYEVEDYKVDLFLSDFKLAIEIDGIFHYEPIHGTDRLARTIAKDAEKNRILEIRGIHLLRIKDKQKKPGMLNCHNVCEKVEKILKKIKTEQYVFEMIEID